MLSPRISLALTETLREKSRDRKRRARAAMTPEQMATEREAARIRMAKRYAALSPAQKLAKIQKTSAARRKRAERQRESDAAARRARRVFVRAGNRAVIDINPRAIMDQISRSIPRSIFRDIRDDIANDMMIALLDGDLAIAEIQGSYESFLAAHLKAREWRNTWSLDAPIWSDSSKTLLDTLTTENAVLL